MLPFTEEIFFSLIARYNAATWPLPAIGWLLCLGAVVLTLRGVGNDGRSIPLLLGALWGWVGIAFHHYHFSTIFFAAPLFAALFVVQGLLFAWAGQSRRVDFRFRSGPVSGAALGLLAFALVGWPALDWFASGDWRSARLAGTTPAATTAFTLGLLLLAERRLPLILMVIPLIWAVVAGAGAWVLGMPEAISLPFAGLGTFALMLCRRRRILSEADGD